MISRIGAVFAHLLVVLLFLMGPALAQSADAVLAENPALAALHADDPERAQTALTELDRILSDVETETLPKGDARGSNPSIESILKVNPALNEAYKRDPRATAKLIDVIKPVR